MPFIVTFPTLLPLLHAHPLITLVYIVVLLLVAWLVVDYVHTLWGELFNGRDTLPSYSQVPHARPLPTFCCCYS